MGVLTLDLQDDNKLVYYILEDALAGSALATKYLRRAAIWNGHEAYYFLYDGYALSGPANAAILLGQLTNFRFQTDETPSEVVLRLQELFDELESVPGNAAVTLNSTQKINYLLSAIRPERCARWRPSIPRFRPSKFAAPLRSRRPVKTSVIVARLFALMISSTPRINPPKFVHCWSVGRLMLGLLLPLLWLTP